METTTNVQNLIEKYNLAKEAYYTGEPIMSDEAFDLLEDELLELGFSPKVGYVVDDINIAPELKIPHINNVLSLGKQKILKETMDIEIAEKLFTKYGESDLSWKYDGLAINLNYQNGKLISAATRGTGKIGRNVMYKLKNKIPQTISITENVELRFEAVMKNSIFNEKYKDSYAHPRNLVAGIFNDITETDKRLNDVDLVLLEAIYHNGTIGNIMNFKEFQQKTLFKIDSIESLKNAFDNASKNRSIYPYGTDGMVLTSVHKTKFEHNGHHPKHAMAIKFMPPKLTSTITKITWKLHRTGNYKPTIHFQPILVDGRKITKASGYNMAYIINNDLCEGKEINVFLANDIIPMVRTLNDNSEPFFPMTKQSLDIMYSKNS